MDIPFSLKFSQKTLQEEVLVLKLGIVHCSASLLPTFQVPFPYVVFLSPLYPQGCHAVPQISPPNPSEDHTREPE